MADPYERTAKIRDRIASTLTTIDSLRVQLELAYKSLDDGSETAQVRLWEAHQDAEQLPHVLKHLFEDARHYATLRFRAVTLLNSLSSGLATPDAIHKTIEELAR